MILVRLILSVLCMALATISAHAQPLYPERLAPAHRMVNGSVNHVFLKKLPIPQPRNAATPPPPKAAATTIMNPPSKTATSAASANPYENAPFQIKPLSDYPKQ